MGGLSPPRAYAPKSRTGIWKIWAVYSRNFPRARRATTIVHFELADPAAGQKGQGLGVLSADVEHGPARREKMVRAKTVGLYFGDGLHGEARSRSCTSLRPYPVATASPASRPSRSASSCATGLKVVGACRFSTTLP